MNQKQQQFLSDYSNAVIKHSTFFQAEKSIQRALETSRITGKPSSMLLTGESGTGKTTLCEYTVSNYKQPHKVQTEDAVIDIVPAFYCSVPAQVSIKGLATSMLRGLGEANLSGDTHTLVNRVISLLKVKQTEFIVLDEFHHLLRIEAAKTRQGVCDWVKHIINYTAIPIIISGLPKCSEIIQGDSELNRRFPYSHELDDFRFSLDPHSGYIKMIRVLSKLMVDENGIQTPPALTLPHAAKAIYCATSGNLSSLSTLLFTALQNSIDDRCQTIDLKALARTFETIASLKCITMENPFDMQESDLDKAITHGKV